MTLYAMRPSASQFGVLVLCCYAYPCWQQELKVLSVVQIGLCRDEGWEQLYQTPASVEGLSGSRSEPAGHIHEGNDCSAAAASLLAEVPCALWHLLPPVGQAPCSLYQTASSLGQVGLIACPPACMSRTPHEDLSRYSCCTPNTQYCVLTSQKLIFHVMY